MPEHRGGLFRILGKIASSAYIKTEIAEEISDYLLEHLCKTVHPYDVLDGLAWAASGKFTPPEQKTNICYIFLTLTNKQLPQNIYHEKMENEEKVFEFDFKTTAYTDLLPILITGLKRIAVAETTPKSLRQKVVCYCLKKWNDIAEYRIIWGPKSTTDLAQAMTEMCFSPYIEIQEKLDISKALYKKIDIFSVTEMLTEIFKNVDSDQLGGEAEKVAKRLLDFANDVDYSSAEDREVIMRCIGKLLNARKLAEKTRASENVRERLLYTLFEGLREQVFQVDYILRELSESDCLSKRLKKEIQKRLPSGNLVKA